MNGFRSGTVAKTVHSTDGGTEIVVVQVTITPVSSEDEGNMDVVVAAALGTVNGYDITMNNGEVVSMLRYMADQIEAQG